MSVYREHELGKRLHLRGPRPVALVLSWKLMTGQERAFYSVLCFLPLLGSEYSRRSLGISRIDLGLVVPLRQDGYNSPHSDVHPYLVLSCTPSF